MAAHNEEKILPAKLDSIFNTHYPTQCLHVLVGSDNSTDQTNAILAQYAERYPNLHYLCLEGRNGKINTINKLSAHFSHLLQQPQAVLVLTDANVLFTPYLYQYLAAWFSMPQIGIVGANVLNVGIQKSGISYQEQWYIQRENNIKHYEGLAGGCMMGAFGACYALRASLWTPVPHNFIVDDFYLTMHVLQQGYAAIAEPAAICYEDVSDDIWEEFRRKRRISAGNFQNLHAFSTLLCPNKGLVAFCFWSHKVIRWLGAIVLPFLLLCAFILAKYNPIYYVLFILQLGLYLSPIADNILKKVGLHSRLIRFSAYFCLMNIALLLGFFHYIKGINNNVWKPTRRNSR